MVSVDSEVRALLDRQSDAFRRKDLDGLMALYSPDVIYFDVVPPLQYVGSAALRARFSEWFASFAETTALEFRDLQVKADAGMAIATRLSRARGRLRNGRDIGSWVRATTCCVRSHGGWVIAHEHVSWPVDPASGRAVMDAR